MALIDSRRYGPQKREIQDVQSARVSYLRRDELDRDRRLELRVLGAPDRSHAALSELRAQHVTSYAENVRTRRSIKCVIEPYGEGAVRKRLERDEPPWRFYTRREIALHEAFAKTKLLRPRPYHPASTRDNHVDLMGVRWPVSVVTISVVTACSLMTNLDDLASDAGGAAADSPPEATPDAYTGCDPAAPFTSIVPIGGVSQPGLNEFKPSLSADELEIWLGIEDDAGALFVENATRTAIDASFGPTSQDPVMNPTGANADPWLSDDALSIVITHQPGQVGLWDLYGSTRPSRDAGFSAPTPLVNVQSVASEIAPYIGGDGSLYFASNRNGNFDVFVAARSGNGFVAPVPITELNSSVDESAVVVTRDGLWVYVESKRTDLSIGGEDIFRAHRATATDAFGPLEPVGELNTSFNERMTWISPDNCRLYFESNRLEGTTARDIFVASK